MLKKSPSLKKQVFHLILIKPTRYDDDGYPVRWLRSGLPANTLACMRGIAEDCRHREVLGPDVEMRIKAIDECNQRIDPAKMIAEIKASGGHALIGMVGVQSNQFPRAIDLAKPFCEAGISVAIGGFHVSGCVSMLDDLPSEIVAAQDMGISIFAGEAEQQRFDQVLLDAYAGTLPKMYDFTKDMPDLRDQPLPVMPLEEIQRYMSAYSSFDLGRGCPYQCSFCCIINVQGRVSRFRTTDDLEKIIRTNHAIGINWFFVTDDNFARNKNWEAFLDLMIELRESEGIKLRLLIQVDTLCHQIPNFIDKACKAGVDQVFIGLENINPDNLLATNKRQNHITEYREMLMAWKRYPVVITASYIIGLPNDTMASVLSDIEVIKRELPIDTMNLACLTPLPGSADHKGMVEAGTWMDPDLNKYDLVHRVTNHPKMSAEEWETAYREAARSFYSHAHMVTILKRMIALGSDRKLTTINRLVWYGSQVNRSTSPSLDNGILRFKRRKERRPGQPIESPLAFYPAYWTEAVWGILQAYLMRLRLLFDLWQIMRNPKRMDYMDTAITPTNEGEMATLDLFSQTRGGGDAVTKQRKINARKKDRLALDTSDAEV